MKRALLILLALPLLLPALLVTAFYARENWIGSVAWQRVEERLRAEGEPLTVEALQPKPVPDARNMAAAPVFRELFTYYNPQRASVYDVVLPPPARGTVPIERSALIAMARRFQPDFDGDAPTAAEIVLRGLAPLEPLLDAIRLAAARPDSVWPANSARGPAAPGMVLPPLRRTTEVLAARASASMAGRQSASALADFDLIARLAVRSNQPPLIAGCYAEQKMLGYAVDIVREGLAHDAWSDEDLAAIQSTLEALRPLEDFREAVRGERALFLESPTALSPKAEALFTFVDYRSRISRWLTSASSWLAWNARPSGWDARDRASFASFAQDWVSLVIHNGIVRPWALAEWNSRLGAVRRDRMEFFRTPLTVLILPTFGTAARGAAYGQARIDFARLACAIEQARRATGKIPASLDELAPRWMKSVPRDIVGGGRYFYAVSGSNYTLYGRGWNARDDGGSNAHANVLLGPSTADDWVWNPR